MKASMISVSEHSLSIQRYLYGGLQESKLSTRQKENVTAMAPLLLRI